MSAVPFDTLKLADRLEAGGFTPEQARTFASALADAASSAELVTKPDLDDAVLVVRRDLNDAVLALRRDLNDAVLALRRDLNDSVLGLKPDIENLKLDMDANKREGDAARLNLEQRVTIRLGSMLVIAVGVLLAAIRYLPPSPH